MKIALITLIVYTILGCSNASRINDSSGIQLEEIVKKVSEDEGFVDVYLKIISDTKTDSSHIYVAKGVYKKQVLGLEIEVRSNLPAGLVDGSLGAEGAFASQGVRIKSIGAESDTFIGALSELYGFPTHKNFTRKTITGTLYSLNDKVANLENSDYYKFKVFFEEDNEDLYSEIFLNINTANQEIEWREKDPENRKQLIEILTQ